MRIRVTSIVSIREVSELERTEGVGYSVLHLVQLSLWNKDKVAVVTGAARGESASELSLYVNSQLNVDAGIGQATSIALAKSGTHVAIIDLDLDRLKETKEAVESEGANEVCL